MSFPLYREDRTGRLVELIISRPEFVVVRDPATWAQHELTVENFLARFEPCS